MKNNSIYDKPIQIFETSEEELIVLFQRLNNIDSNKNIMFIYGPDNIGSIRLFIKYITL